MPTVLEPAVKEIDLSLLDDEEWCIVDTARPDFGLCGSFLDNSDANVPDEEVPDEYTCPACLVLQRLHARRKWLQDLSKSP